MARRRARLVERNENMPAALQGIFAHQLLAAAEIGMEEYERLELAKTTSDRGREGCGYHK